jgi:hypothetical protein
MEAARVVQCISTPIHSWYQRNGFLPDPSCPPPSDRSALDEQRPRGSLSQLVKILISSHAFRSGIGGIEHCQPHALLQEFLSGWMKRSWLVTSDSGRMIARSFRFSCDSPPSFNASSGAAGEMVRPVWQKKQSQPFATIWPLWLLHRPVIITHQGSYAASGRDRSCATPSSLPSSSRRRRCTHRAVARLLSHRVPPDPESLTRRGRVSLSSQARSVRLIWFSLAGLSREGS